MDFEKLGSNGFAFAKLDASLEPGGFLWIGGNERVPEIPDGWGGAGGLFRKPGA